jgi:hypothetical protein
MTTGRGIMKRLTSKLSALLVVGLLVTSLGGTQLLAAERVVGVRNAGAETAQKSDFQFWFSGYARFLRVGNRIANLVVPITAVPTFEPEPEAESSSVYFFFSQPQDPSEDTNSVDFGDDPDPIL